jgi:hypothetical protein
VRPQFGAYLTIVIHDRKTFMVQGTDIFDRFDKNLKFQSFDRQETLRRHSQLARRRRKRIRRSLRQIRERRPSPGRQRIVGFGGSVARTRVDAHSKRLRRFC